MIRDIQESPFFTNGYPDFRKVKKLTGFTYPALNAITGIPEATLKSGGKPQLVNISKSQDLLMLLNLLWDLVEGNDNLARQWLQSPQKAYNGICPIQVMMMGKIKSLIEDLAAEVEGEISS